MEIKCADEGVYVWLDVVGLVDSPSIREFLGGYPGYISRVLYHVLLRRDIFGLLDIPA